MEVRNQGHDRRLAAAVGETVYIGSTDGNLYAILQPHPPTILSLFTSGARRL